MKISTQPLTKKAPLAVACAVEAPVETLEGPHAAIASAIVRLPETLDVAHFGAAPVLTRMSSSNHSCALCVAPPGFKLPGLV